MDADKEIYTEVYDLVAKGWLLDSALHEIALVRSDVTALLQLRPKPAPTPQIERRPRPRRGEGREKGGGVDWTPPTRPSRPSKPDPGWGEAKGKGKEKGKNKSKGSPAMDGWDASWLRERVVNGRTINFCMRFNVGDCRIRGCRFAHGCAVPKADGTPCNGNHAAIDHNAGAAPRT